MSRKAFTLIVGVLYLQINAIFQVKLNRPNDSLGSQVGSGSQILQALVAAMLPRRCGSNVCRSCSFNKNVAVLGGQEKSEDTQTPNHSKATESFFCVFFFGRTGKDPMRSTQPLLSIILKLRQEPPQIKRTGH